MVQSSLPPGDNLQPKRVDGRRRKAVQAGKPRQATRRTAASPKGRPRGRKSPKGKKELPLVVKLLLMGGCAALFVVGFYYLFIRPYAYRWKSCYGAKAYGVCLPTGFPVHGFDVSHHQGDIDWEALRSTQTAPFPIRFVFMKASEGGDFSDTTFTHNFDMARKHGFIRGAYHFFNPKTDPIRQADFFIESVRLESGDLPPVLDIEKRGKDDRRLRAQLKMWLDRVESHYKVKPILYTSYKFKTRYLNDSVFNTYPYWIAHYYVDSVEYDGPWTFWQHTDAGRLPGIGERVDLNVFNGSLEQLQQLLIP